MLQATVCDCLAFDPFAFEEDGVSAPEEDVSRGKIVECHPCAMRIKRRPNDAYEVGGYFKVAYFDGTHVLSAELADEIAEFKDHVLARPRFKLTALRAANIIRR